MGGPADLLVDAFTESALVEALAAVRAANCPWTVLGGGSNLVVASGGFAGVAIRYRDDRIQIQEGSVQAGSGASLQDLVDATIRAGLQGLHTMTRIPGWVGGAIYGNAGAYGHSIHEFVESVRFVDGVAIRSLSRDECDFAYRESRFKREKSWIILSAQLRLPPGDPEALRQEATRIQQIRDAKYPPTMRCAGSIFKNLLLRDLPASLADSLPPSKIIEGKVPSAYFLELAGAKGLKRGGIQVADYHANLLYNTGGGTAEDLRILTQTLKQRVLEQSGIHLEEEVQCLGFGSYTGVG
jgi:UDP-N-acetylmuramate dehydrogenase